MTNVLEAKVFSDESGNYGDMHGIIVDEERVISPDKRLEIAKELKYAETIFINDIKNADVSFYSQTGEIPFAGTAALAVTKVLEKLTGFAPSQLLSQNNSILVGIDDVTVWSEADLSIMPSWNIKMLDSAHSVEMLNADDMKSTEHTVLWAWVNEKEGTIRARTFAQDWKLPEVEANGSGSMLLASKLGRDIVVMHGNGSKILASPSSNGKALLGGRVSILDVPVKR